MQKFRNLRQNGRKIWRKKFYGIGPWTFYFNYVQILTVNFHIIWENGVNYGQMTLITKKKVLRRSRKQPLCQLSHNQCQKNNLFTHDHLYGLFLTCTGDPFAPFRFSYLWLCDSGTRSWSGSPSDQATLPARTFWVWRCTRSSGTPVRASASGQMWTSCVDVVDARPCVGVLPLKWRQNSQPGAPLLQKSSAPTYNLTIFVPLQLPT